jgi:hypothetical protein
MSSIEPVLHGREVPLGALRTLLEGAFAGRGRVALISGEAGMGKSALAAAIAREAEARGARVTWGRAWEFADAPPYFPVWPCLRTLGIEIGGATSNGQSPEGHDAGQAFQLWESVVAALARASSSEPRVWVLEDLHAADLGTLDLLTFLAQPLHALRVLVIATVRAQDPRLTGRMNQRLTRMARDGLDLPLEPLNEREIAALTAQTLGRAVPESALRRLAELTGGNPLFVVECVRAFRAAGGIEGTLGSLPPTVRQVVLERLALLPVATRKALAGGAVLGREFAAAQLAHMGDSLPAGVIDTLLPALRAGLIQELAPGRFLFSHALVRDAIDDALHPTERAALHARAELALAALGDTLEILVERARHGLAAMQNGNEANVLGLVQRATELLEREGAFDRAFELYSRMADAQRTGLLPPASAAEKLRAAHAARAAGCSEASRRLCEELVESARTAGDAALLARAALLHAADVRPAVMDRSQVVLLEEARAALGDGAPELGCRVLARLATALQPARDPRVPQELAREAIRRARATRDDAVLLEVLDVAAWALYEAPLAERSRCAAELLERALAANDRPRALIAYEWVAFQQLEAGELDAFSSAVEKMLALSDEIGHPRYRWHALLIASARAMMLGYFSESDRYVTEVAALAPLTDDPALPLALAIHALMRGQLHCGDEQQRTAIAQLDGWLKDVPPATLMGPWLRAGCHARLEDIAATRAELALIGARLTVFKDDPTLPLLAEAYALAGTDADRRWLRDLIGLSSSQELSTGQGGYTYEGSLPRLLGLLDAALGDLPGAERQLLEAHRRAVARRQAPWIAQTAYELGKLLRRAGREEEACGWIEECVRIARELGMRGLEQRASAHALPAPSGAARDAAVRIEKSDAGWSITRAGTTLTLKDSRGLQWLAKLVERADEEIHVLTLASADPAAALAESSAGEVLDEQARRAYRSRLSELEQALAEAESRAQTQRAAKLLAERQVLVTELARAVGLGRRSRQVGSATERARVNVQRRLKDAIARIGELDEGLGRFFESSVHTGTFCCFRRK